MANMYYAQNPNCLSEEKTLEYEAAGQTVRLITDHGVFSGSRVDFGTDLLIRTLVREENALSGAPESVLDLGCGYGVVACLLGKIWPSSAFTLVDVNERAMELARRNLQKNGVPKSEVISREKLDLSTDGAHTAFDVIATNPPIRAGKETVQGFFSLSYERLKKGGRLYVVIQKKQGAESAFRFLEGLFGRTETVERSAGYHIIQCIK